MELTEETLGLSASRRLWRRAALALGAGTALACTALLALHLVLLGEALPGTTVEGQAVGGLGMRDLRARISEIASAHTGEKIVVVGGGRRRELTPEAIGYEVDLGATVRAAMNNGREGGLWADLWADVSSVARVRSVGFSEELDRAALRRVVASMKQATNRRPTTGSIGISKKLEVTAVVPRAGAKLRRAETERRIVRALGRPRSSVTHVAVTTLTPPLRARSVRRVAAAAERYLSRDLVLSRGGATVEFAPREVAPLLTMALRGPSEAPTVALGVKPKPLDRLLEAAKEKVNRPPTGAGIHPPVPPAVFAEPGDVTWRPRRAAVSVTRAKRGRKLITADTAPRLEAAVSRGDHSIRMAVDLTPPKLTVAEARRVDHMIGTFTTFHACCEARVDNIHRIADIVDGTMVMPGETFSLNQAAGERTLEQGFVPAPTIIDGEIVDTVGGGVSQFSTTTYNAAYFAGLQIDYHKPHSFYISRYPLGREATVNWPNVDLLWTNDTAHPIVVRTSYTDTSITVALYGSNGGRVVSARAGSTRPWAGGAFKLTVTRHIRYRDGRTATDSYTTHYAEPAH